MLNFQPKEIILVVFFGKVWLHSDVVHPIFEKTDETFIKHDPEVTIFCDIKHEQMF